MRISAESLAPRDEYNSNCPGDEGFMSESQSITVIPLNSVNEIPLPNGSWSKMALTRESVSEIASSLGFSVFKPGTLLAMVSHEVEEVAFVVSGSGELRTDGGAVPFAAGEAIHIPAGVWHAVANTGIEDVIMVFGFPYPSYPPTERRSDSST
jgi:mannose-6-phosphate isomerase-like protein (cupin superfamily)